MVEKVIKEKRVMLPRTVKWEIGKNRPELVARIVTVSDDLREYEHWALECEKMNYERHKKILKLVEEGVLLVSEHITKDGKKYKLVLLKGEKVGALFPKSFLTDFDLYTLYKLLREEDVQNDRSRGNVPANWVLESCFRKVASAYKSFFGSIQRGDPDARTIKPSETWDFVAIQGALNRTSIKGEKLILAPNIFPCIFEFAIPKEYQAKMLACSIRLAKFVISRDEPDMREFGRFWISVTYEISKPETLPFVPEEGAYIALGASSIGVVSPKGAEVIPLWRSDKYWVPYIREVEESIRHPSVGTKIHALTKGSRNWRKRMKARAQKFRTMGRQQKQDRREVVAIDLIEKTADGMVSGHGVHFVVSDLVVRSKEGKLADASKPERGGALGLNWAAQNTGTIAYLVQRLEQKVVEYGGTVRKHKLPYTALPRGLPEGHENKIPMAQALRNDFLKSFVA